MSLISALVDAIKEGPQTNLERRLLAFLFLNYSFCFFEIFYGTFLNSLGLVCDGLHMSINCIGISLSWLAMRISHSKQSQNQNQSYSYGYGRVQVLAAFVNAVVLVFVCMFLFIKAIARFFEPDELDIHASHAIIVAISSLLLNIFGLLIILSVKADGEYEFDFSLIFNNVQDGLPFTQNKKHDINGKYWQSPHAKKLENWLNVKAVTVHLKADILSSIGLIISTTLVHTYNLKSFDALVSIAILGLIFQSALPLLVSSGRILLQASPTEMKLSFDKALREIGLIKGVIECHEHHFWTFSLESYVATLKIRIRDDADRKFVFAKAHEILSPTAGHITIQIVSDSDMSQSNFL